MMPSTENSSSAIFPSVTEYLEACRKEFHAIPDDRKQVLESVAKFVQKELQSKRPARLTFICTHNSRRSHLSQIWAQVAAAYYRVHPVETFSGGTEATALNPRAVAAMRRAGLSIAAKDPNTSNPIYEVQFASDVQPMLAFSKIYNSPPNPVEGYCAIMTCSHADEACPLAMGCASRIAVRYDDPKASDDTPEESAIYDERCRQICREMLYLFSKAER
ncbi:MAG: protein-tyrosine-phosphatase [Pirellula sp.]|nr:protein-tyrosine-phosphatase [Pirellula sp.]